LFFVLPASPYLSGFILQQDTVGITWLVMGWSRPPPVADAGRRTSNEQGSARQRFHAQRSATIAELSGKDR